jgi:hypothetical protein
VLDHLLDSRQAGKLSFGEYDVIDLERRLIASVVRVDLTDA